MCSKSPHPHEKILIKHFDLNNTLEWFVTLGDYLEQNLRFTFGASDDYLDRAILFSRGANTDHVAEGHCEGEGAGGECAPSCAEPEAETTSILQSEGVAKKRSIATLYI